MKSITKHQKILDSALTLFQNTHDVKKVSLEDIASQAHVSPTTIYNYFGTRETLVYEIVKILIRQMMEQSKAFIHSDIPFPQKLMSIINTKKDMVTQVNGEIINKIVSQDKALAPFIDELFKNEVRPLWLEMLADGKNQGYIDPNLDDEVLLIYLDVLRAGFSVKQELMQNIASKVDLLMQLTHILFYGFLKKDIGLRLEEK